jgi:hypothetical protein
MYEGARHIRITEAAANFCSLFEKEDLGPSPLSELIVQLPTGSRAFIPASD